LEFIYTSIHLFEHTIEYYFSRKKKKKKRFEEFYLDQLCIVVTDTPARDKSNSIVGLRIASRGAEILEVHRLVSRR
jgi:hypothetical protein